MRGDDGSAAGMTWLRPLTVARSQGSTASTRGYFITALTGADRGAFRRGGRKSIDSMEMTGVNGMAGKWMRWLVILLAACGGAACLGQGAVGQDQELKQNQNQDQEQADKSVRPTLDQKLAGDSPAATQAPTQAPSSPSTADRPKEEVKITPREAEELFHSVDEILAFDSKQTGLPIKKEVKRKLTSREEVVSYLTKHMNDEDTQRLRRSELVLKKFGLLPRDFDLEKLLVALLREQVAGYYDPKT